MNVLIHDAEIELNHYQRHAIEGVEEIQSVKKKKNRLLKSERELEREIRLLSSHDKIGKYDITNIDNKKYLS